MSAAQTTGSAIIRRMPRTVQVAAFIVALYVLLVACGPLIAPYGQATIVGDAYMPWSSHFWLGTDSLGRDVLSRLLYGARNSVGIALTINAISFLAGTILGITAAIIGGWLDNALSRFMELIMAFPQMILALLVLTIFGSSLPNLIIVVALMDTTRIYRLARLTAQQIVVNDFFEIARLRGERLWWCIYREILPNIAPPLFAEFGIRFCFVFLFISGLSFLGLGLQPPAADWGSMIRENSILLTFGNFTPMLPAAAIAILCVSVNFVADWSLRQFDGKH